jgi:hypothetical protein
MKYLLPITVAATLLATGCAMSEVSTASKYREGDRVYKSETSGKTNEDASKLNDELYKVWAADVNKGVPADVVGAHIATLRKYKMQLSEKEDEVLSGLDTDTKKEKIRAIKAVKADIDKYLAGFEGDTDVMADIQLDEKFKAKAEGESEKDAGVVLREQAMKYFEACNAANAKNYKAFDFAKAEADFQEQLKKVGITPK